MRRENTKKFKINVMDILVILLVLVCIASIVFRSVVTKDTFPTKEYSVHFIIEDIKASSYSYFEGHEGEAIRLTKDGKVLGHLGSLFSQGSAVHSYTVEYTVEKDGEEKVEKETKCAFYPMFTDSSVYSQQRCSIMGEFVVIGNMGKNGVFVNGESYLAPEMLVEIQTENVKALIKIINIEEK